MENAIRGFHHVTAMAGEATRNVDFYTRVLGMRLVKKTVNYDDPGTYHFYYGDHAGTPGTILTFFPWPSARLGRRGAGEAHAVAFEIGQTAREAWIERLVENNVVIEQTETRFGDAVVRFADPDGIIIELVASGAQTGTTLGPLHSTTLVVANGAGTEALLTKTLGFTFVGEEHGRRRFAAADGKSLVDIVVSPDAKRGLLGAGSIHHVAWRTTDDATQTHWQAKIADAGLGVSEQLDRQYFESIYFREPGDVLFEIATDGPGFAADESVENLGSGLKLPTWLEPHRPQIEAALPSLEVAK